ncbi:hypothetical protein [Niallia circulans]|uniref:hypothetical protein n=1 Tax=Niallia circulans TaxID=1397 RepID=UPI002E1D8553|nr:hypothetical protein [Niallia circulans]
MEIKSREKTKTIQYSKKYLDTFFENTLKERVNFSETLNKSAGLMERHKYSFGKTGRHPFL